MTKDFVVEFRVPGCADCGLVGEIVECVGCGEVFCIEHIDLHDCPAGGEEP